MLRFAYDTAGCTRHRLEDALDLIAETGYEGACLALGFPHFDPFADDLEGAATALARRLRDLDLALVIDARAPFALDPHAAHEPTLLHPTVAGRQRRIELIGRAIRICALCSGTCVSLISGRPQRGVSGADAGAWLLDGLKQVAEHAAREGVAIALEPAAGHLVGSAEDVALVREALAQTTDAPLHLSLEAGRPGEADAAAVRRSARLLGAVALQDASAPGTALAPFARSDPALPAVLAALEAAEYEGLVTVRAPLYAEHAPEAMAAALTWLKDQLPSD